MISRIWHGWTTPTNADVYEGLLKEEIFTGIQQRKIRGFAGIQLLRRVAGVEVEFVTIMRYVSSLGRITKWRWFRPRRGLSSPSLIPVRSIMKAGKKGAVNKFGTGPKKLRQLRSINCSCKSRCWGCHAGSIDTFVGYAEQQIR